MLVAAADQRTVDDLGSCMDVHMTDATSHNKTVAEEVASVFN